MINHHHLAYPLYTWMEATPNEVDDEVKAGMPTGRIKTVEYGRLGDVVTFSVFEFRLLLREHRERDKVALLVFRKPGMLVVVPKEGTI